MSDPIIELIHPVPKDVPFRVDITGTNSDDLLNLINPVGTESPQSTGPVRSPSYQAGANAPGAVRGLLSVLNGPTMGFGDEIVGGVGGIYDSLMNPGTPFSEAYQSNRDYARGAQDVEQQANPWTTGLTQVAASAPLMAVRLGGALMDMAPKAVQGASKVMFGDASGVGSVMNIGQKTARAGGTGGATGAISGAGNSTAEDLGGVLEDAGKGGATGVLVGGAAPGAASVLGSVTSPIYQRGMSAISDKYATNLARQKLAEALVRDGSGNVVEAGLSNPVLQAQTRMGKLGPNAVIADSAGENVKDLLDTMATLPGRTKNAVANFQRERRATSGERMIEAADNALGNNGQRLTATVDGLIEQRAAASKPLYDQVRQMSIEPDFELTSIIKAADKLGASSVAKKMAIAEMDEFSLKVSNPQSWSMTDLDRVKRGLDNLIEGQIDPNGKLSSLGVTYLGLKKKMVTKLDDMTIDPATGESIYKAARNAFAGPSSLIDAAKIGRKSLSQKADDIARITSDFSESEKEAFRVGAFEALRDKLGSSQAGRTEIQNMYENKVMQEKLKAIFGSERAFREFAADVAGEARLKALQKTNQGSKTASRLASAEDLADVGAGIEAVGHAAHGNIGGLVVKGKQFLDKVQTPESVRNEIGRLLLLGPTKSLEEFDQLLPITQMLNRQQADRAKALGGALATQPQMIPWFNPQ